MRRATLLATVLVTVLATGGCGTDEDAPSGAGGPDRIELQLENGQTPPVERVDVEVGTEVELVVTADEAGELHVHSTPEQVLEYSAGTTTITLTIDQPGVVDVERHEPEALLLQLQVG